MGCKLVRDLLQMKENKIKIIRDDHYSIVHMDIIHATMGDVTPMNKSATVFQIATMEVMKTITIAVTLCFELILHDY